jgi:AcrR family transcriptional regulator
MMRPTRRERAAEHTREDILVAAARVFARKGYAAAGVQEIAAEAGFAAASLYSYFKGKRAIWDALRDKIIAEFEALMEKPLPAGLSLEQRLELVLSEQLGWAEGRRDEFVAVMSPPPAEASDGPSRPRRTVTRTSSRAPPTTWRASAPSTPTTRRSRASPRKRPAT